MSDDWTPAFPGQRPPFAPGNEWRAEPGNQRAIRHGAFSPKYVEPIAARITAELRATDGLDYLNAPRFTTSLWAYARAQAKAELVEQWIASVPNDQHVTASRGKDSPLELLRQLQTRAGNLAERLGLSPVGASEIADEITKARATLARRNNRTNLQADLRAALREQSDQIGGDR